MVSNPQYGIDLVHCLELFHYKDSLVQPMCLVRFDMMFN